MFRLLNKKGFTLVELMIVVVILGILVAIAVPIYSASRANAEKKTCFANMRMIVGACAQYYMEHENYGGLIPDTGVRNLSTDTLPDEFINKFDAEGVPHCPSGGVYTIEHGQSESAVKITCIANSEGKGNHGDYHSQG